MEKIKLFCLPYAGSSATVYMKWKKYLHHSIQLIPIELAGRGKRIVEPLYTDIEEAVNDIYEKIQDELEDTPYAFFGHSMGSLLAFECIHKIRSQKKRMPETIFFSGKKPPHKKMDKIYHVLPNAEFIKEILEMGGTPKEIVEHKELLQIFIPILKADFRIVETYDYKEKGEVFDCDIVAMNGKQDNLTTDMGEWNKYTSGEFRIYNFDGDHFFIHDHLETVVNLINQELIIRRC
ncbi:thioesterase II family protein [Mesobacillus zeae]|uniref:thioesterase II family protein n=1 Tax=Mesobacillus zeae TaxID=1917180 RepID=UPI0015E69A60|nr:thioesterase [Mesobacillus zeae]